MIQLLQIGLLERGILIVAYITLVMVIRKYLNRYGLKHSVMALWGIVLLRLIIPYTVLLQLPTQEMGVIKVITFPIRFISRITVNLSEHISLILPEVNRIIIMIVLAAYIVFQILKANKALKNVKEIHISKKLQSYLMKTVPIKRTVKIFINNDLKAPVTYGILYPKIILQDRIMRDRTMLKYVLVHEMTHIKKFDIVRNHLKNILVCIYWYNPFVWLMSVYITEDLEVLCDKLVVERTGNKEQNKLEYMYVMFQVLTQGQKKEKAKIADTAMKLNPTVERMVILKTMKIRKIGILTMIVALFLSTTAFAHVEEKKVPPTKVMKSSENIAEESVLNLDKVYVEEDINQDNRTTVISKDIKEGEMLPAIADINESCSLSAFGSKTHKFTMYNFYGGVHKNFITEISNASSTGAVLYEIVIEEGREIIYRGSFKGDVTLKTEEAKNNRDYKVTVINRSNESLNYDISIQSYR